MGIDHFALHSVLGEFLKEHFKDVSDAQTCENVPVTYGLVQDLGDVILVPDNDKVKKYKLQGV